MPAQYNQKSVIHSRIPSILGVLVLVLGLAAGVMLISQQQIFRLGASADTSPQDVRISNVTDTSFTVSWFTGKPTLGYINWGQTPSLGQSKKGSTTLTTTHTLTIDGLSPGTNYYFVINSAGMEFDNNGIPWSTASGPSLPSPVTALLASGTVLTSDGKPAQNVLVYVNSGGFAQLSAITSQNGAWTLPLSIARTRTLSSYANLGTKDAVVDIFVQGADAGVATAQVLLSQINPTPNIVLGRSHDFTNQEVTAPGDLPTANVSLPEEEEVGQGTLDVSSGDLGLVDENPVTLDSIDEEDEVVFTSNPEFFGEGPQGTTITITVESDPVSSDVKIGPSGEWRWSPPTDLENGAHTVTVSWTDASGFLRRLTRTFTVAAAENEPGFESTPSAVTATPSPTPSPSPTPTPTKSPTPTASATKSPSPTPSPSPSVSPSPIPARVSIPSTESGIPVAGVSAPTLILTLVGLGLFVSGIFISKKFES